MVCSIKDSVDCLWIEINARTTKVNAQVFLKSPEGFGVFPTKLCTPDFNSGPSEDQVVNQFLRKVINKYR